jgi:CRP/FNR family transcriptional activator FtrB
MPLPSAVWDALSFSPLFSGLSDADRRLLLADARVAAHADAVPLFDQGAVAGRFFIVLDGHVELFIDEKDRRQVVEVAGRGTILGEAALVGDGQYLTSARVVGFARIVEVSAGPFLHLLETRFDVAVRMLGSMSMRLRALVAQIAELKLKTTAQRLAGFLLGLASGDDDAAVVRFPYDKRLAAENLGMTAESLSRALARLAPLGVESRADNVVVLADLAALRKFCGEDDGL